MCEWAKVQWPVSYGSVALVTYTVTMNYNNNTGSLGYAAAVTRRLAAGVWPEVGGCENFLCFRVKKEVPNCNFAVGSIIPWNTVADFNSWFNAANLTYDNFFKEFRRYFAVEGILKAGAKTTHDDRPSAVAVGQYGDVRISQTDNQMILKQKANLLCRDLWLKPPAQTPERFAFDLTFDDKPSADLLYDHEKRDSVYESLWAGTFLRRGIVSTERVVMNTVVMTRMRRTSYGKTQFDQLCDAAALADAADSDESDDDGAR